MTYKSTCLTIFLPLLLLQVASAQPLSRDRPGPPRTPGEKMRRLEHFKKIRLMEVLHLDEQESIRFFSRYDKFETELRKLESERSRIIDDLDSLAKHEERAEAYQKYFDDLISLGQRQADVRMRFYKDIRAILTPRQVAELIVFERDFSRELREIIQDVQQRRRGPGPPY